MLHKTNKIVLCAFMSLWSICVWSANGKVIYIATDIHVMDSSLQKPFKLLLTAPSAIRLTFS